MLHDIFSFLNKIGQMKLCCQALAILYSKPVNFVIELRND